MPTTSIIGTAGRDKNMPMTLALWDWMLADATSLIAPGSHLVSGGAAWADHLAVALFLSGHASALTLHLPAPFRNGRFVGPSSSAGSASNYYHQLFSRAIGRNTLADIAAVASMPNVSGTFEPAAPGFTAMFARNKLVAKSDHMLAYTFGTGAVPADGGTANTWNQCTGNRLHVPLPILR